MAETVHSEIPHFFEMMKIIEGALNADRNKVLSYVEQLAQKLEVDGNVKAAERLRRTTNQSKLGTLSAANINTVMQLPVDSESRMALADEKHFDADSTRVFVDRSVQLQLDEFLHFVRNADKLVAHGVGVSPSLLMCGPPGCGKTEIAKFLAAQLRLPLVTARIDSLVSSYLGSTAKNMRSLFEHAMGRPCVLFLDELDAIGKLRDDRHELGELKRVVVSLLQNIDSLENQTILIAATNHEHLLDPALWRRFAFKLKIGLPSELAREALFQHFLAEFADRKLVSLYAHASAGLSGADIRQIADDAKRAAILNGETTSSKPYILKRVIELRVPELLQPTKSLEEKLRLARELDPALFSYRVLSELYDKSTGYVHKVLNKQQGKADEQ
ncbi:MAG TPA: ATP-binding protein [Drouetiella sp.]